MPMPPTPRNVDGMGCAWLFREPKSTVIFPEVLEVLEELVVFACWVWLVNENSLFCVVPKSAVTPLEAVTGVTNCALAISKPVNKNTRMRDDNTSIRVDLLIFFLSWRKRIFLFLLFSIKRYLPLFFM